jgi:hypothetical protein
VGDYVRPRAFSARAAEKANTTLTQAKKIANRRAFICLVEQLATA